VADGDLSTSWIGDARASLERVIRGKPRAIDLVLTGVLAGGHILIEDVPGVGKTTLAKTLARSLSLSFARIQFTPDLLPSDILGTNTLSPKDHTISFLPGPIFTNVVLADEINRASPRTQSALLEAMNESQVTVDGKTMPLPSPFIVLATQNPVDFHGTYPLPEAQLDRFVIRVSMGYPSLEEEVGMLFDRQESDPLSSVTQVVSRDHLIATQEKVRHVEVRPDVARYLARLCQKSRGHPDIALGASPRGSLVLFRACQARALLSGRSYVTPDDVRDLALPVLSHRIQLTDKARYGGRGVEDVLADLITQIPVPT
jgi:MoxR-like ATPase